MNKKTIVGLAIAGGMGVLTASFTGGLVLSHNLNQDSVAYAIEEKQKQIDDIGDSLSKLEVLITEKDSNFSELKTKYDKLKGDYDSLQQNYNTLLTSSNKDKQDLANLNSQISGLQSQITTLTAEVARLTSKAEEEYQRGFQEGVESVKDEKSAETLAQILSWENVYSKRLSSGAYLVSTTSDVAQGLFMVKDGGIKKVYDKGGSYEYIEEAGNGKVLVSTSETRTLPLLLFNIEEESVEEKITGQFAVMQRLTGGGVLISDLNDGILNGEVRYYDIEDESLDIVKTGLWDTITPLNDGGALLTGNASNYATGIEYFDPTLKTCSKIYSDGYGWTSIKKFNKGDVLLSSVAGEPNKQNTGLTGILRFDPTTKTIMSLNSNGYAWSYFIDIDEDHCLVSTANTYGGLYLYTAGQTSLETVYSDGSDWGYSFKLPNGNFLISSAVKSNYSAGYGIILYNTASKTASKKHFKGDCWDTWEADETGVNISSSQNPQNGKLRYEYATNSLSQIE